MPYRIDERFGKPDAKFAERFWRRVDKKESAGCWNWTGFLRSTGHGQVHCYGKVMKAHRASYLMAYGCLPDGECVLHACDNPACVNPAHLRLGDRADNARDRVDRGRGLRGERHNMAKVTEAQVREIRACPEPARKIAKRYGLSRSGVQAIKRGRVWKHIQQEI